MQGSPVAICSVRRNLQIVQRVGFEHSEQLLLSLFKAELRMLREGAVDIALYHFFHLFLSNADLTERVVPAALWIDGGNRPRYLAYCLQQPCKSLLSASSSTAFKVTVIEWIKKR